jgi:hypothetical protein
MADKKHEHSTNPDTIAGLERLDPEDSEPQEDDITTQDHRTFYQNGRKVLETRDDINGPMRFDYRMEIYSGGRTSTFVSLGTFTTVEAALRAYMERTQFWPNAWVISDHGNAHLIDLTEDK